MAQAPSNYKNAAELDAYRARQKAHAWTPGKQEAPLVVPSQEGLGALAARLHGSAPLTARALPQGLGMASKKLLAALAAQDR